MSVVSRAEDFLYVVVSSKIGVTSEIHWFPADSPLSGRVILEDLRGVSRVYRYEDELWWWPQTSTKPKISNLMGQDLVKIPHVSLEGTSERVRQGNMLYAFTSQSFTSEQLEEVNLETGEQRVLAAPIPRPSGLAIYEDRLYFGASGALESVRVDGTDRRVEWEAAVGEGGGGLFGGHVVRNLTVYQGRLHWARADALWQMDLASREVTMTTPQMPHALSDFAITDSAIYWIGDRTVWRRCHGEVVDEKLYQFGDARLFELCAVTANRTPVTLPDQNHVVVDGEPSAHYQVLYSVDLRDWTSNFVESSLFTDFGTLRWLNPKQAAKEPLVWKIDPAGPEAYFTAWKYALEPPYDADQDDVPDYWERRYFGDLNGSKDGDPDEDGLTNAEEAASRTNPLSADTDEDGLNDGVEVSGEFRSNPLVVDTDGDGLEDGAEVLQYGTNPEVSDSDGDGFTDGFEVAYDSEPGVHESRPERDAALQDQAKDLMVYFDFETSAQEEIPNRGVLGGSGRIVGKESYVTRGEDVETGSRALDFQLDPDDSKIFSHLETDYRLEDLAMSGDRPTYTIALWLRPEEGNTGTLLSARRSESVERRPVSDDHAILISVGGASVSFRLKSASWALGGSWPAAVDPGVWTHIAWSTGPRGRKYYVNGELLREDAVRAGSLEADPVLWIGAQEGRTRALDPFVGAIDDVRVYRQELTADVIKLLSQ